MGLVHVLSDFSLSESMVFIELLSIMALMASLSMPLLQVDLVGNNNETTVDLPDLPVITLENAFGSVTSTLILLTIMLAVTFRQSSEAFAKWYNGEITEFNPKYIAQGIIAFISSLPIGVGLLGGGATVFVAHFGTLGLVGSLVMVAVYAYGWTHGTNKASSLIGHFFTTSLKKSKESNTTESPPNSTTTGTPAP